MAHVFTSLRHPVEKLLEAEHFLGRLTLSNGLEFQFELNAFLSASRSVSLVLQKAMSSVAAFPAWYAQQQASLRADAAARFFLELRNISQKQGPVSFVGGATKDGGWTYRFVGRPLGVPDELVSHDIGLCCAQHLVKLASLIRECASAFPYESCPAAALSEEGMAHLGYTWADVELAIGLPSGWTGVAQISSAERLRMLRREFDALDRDAMERIAGGNIQRCGEQLTFPSSGGADLVDDVALALSSGDTNPRHAFLTAIAKRIEDL